MDLRLDRLQDEEDIKEDSLDIPDCFGEFDKHSRVCFDFCAISIKCAVMQTRHPKIDILEKLLDYNDLFIKPN